MRHVEAKGRRGVANLWILIALAGALVGVPQLRAQAAAQRNAAHQRALPKEAQTSNTEQPKFKGIWEPINYKEDVEFTDVYFATRDEGWASGLHRTDAGEGGFILHTRDGGQNWEVQVGDPHSATRAIQQLLFIDKTHGWATEWSGEMLRTTDGQTWESVGKYPTLSPYTFASTTTGISLRGEQIFRTEDGGRTWKPVFTCRINAEIQGLKREEVCQFAAAHMVSQRVGYAVAKSIDDITFVLAKTVDGGANWALTPVRASGTMGSDGYVYFLDEQTGFVSVYKWGGNVFATNDGGATWRGVIGLESSWVRFADPETGWSIQGNHPLTYTVDGGKRWLSRQIQFPAPVSAFSLPRRDRGYMVGQHGMIYRYRVVPVTYQAVAHSLDGPVMGGFDSPVFAQVATLNDVVAKLRAKLPAIPAGQPGSQALPPSAGANTVGGLPQNAGAAGSAAAGSSLAQAAGAAATGSFQQTTDTTGGTVPQSGGSSQGTGVSSTGAAGSAPGLPSGSNPAGVGSFQQSTDLSSGAVPQSGGFQQDLGTGPVPGGYVDSCCGSLIQQLETTANTFATTVPSFSQRFRNLNLILEGLNFVNSIVNQAYTLKQSIRTLRQAKSAQAAAAALNTVQAQVSGISSSGGFVQDTSVPPQP